MSTVTGTNELRGNRRRALAYLQRAGTASRADLAAELDLPKATVAVIVAELVARGLVTEADRADRSSGPGRPAKLLAPVGGPALVAAVSWSLDVLRAGVMTVAGRIVAAGTTAAEMDLEHGEATDRILQLVDRLCVEAGQTPGELAATVLSVQAPLAGGRLEALPGQVKRPGWLPGWFDDETADELGRRTGRPCVVENDANLSALGEYAFGAGRGGGDQILVKVTQQGVGTGLILGGRLHRGATGSAGELAHVQVRDDGPVCSCGGRGCLIRTIGSELLDLAQPAYDVPLTFETMLDLAGAGDVGLQRLLRDLGRSVGRPLADLCTMLNPGLFILGGSFGPAGEHIRAGLVEVIEHHARPATSAAVRVVSGELGGDAELLGAVVLVRDGLKASAGTPA